MKETYSCNVGQKQEGLSALRLRAVGGDFTVEQLRAIADVAAKYGAGRAHLTTRQGVEIHDVEAGDLWAAQAELEAAGIKMGASGNRVRVVAACPGSARCRYGSIDTTALAAELDARHFRAETPYKVKFGVAGCPNNCGKAREADIGIMGSRVPRWNPEECVQCGACVELCAPGAIHAENGAYLRDADQCVNCSACSVRCPKGCWSVESVGYDVLMGGTLGKLPRLGVPLKKHVATREEVLALVEAALAFYKKNGRPRERLGHLLERLGEDEARRQILAAV